MDTVSYRYGWRHSDFLQRQAGNFTDIIYQLHELHKVNWTENVSHISLFEILKSKFVKTLVSVERHKLSTKFPW